jgi:hypothetical protein
MQYANNDELNLGRQLLAISCLLPDCEWFAAQMSFMSESNSQE